MTSELRVGDAERDRAAADLGEHYALGRLTADEHAERLDAVWTARTRADLDVLFEDLPVQPAPQPHGQPSPRRRPGPGWRAVPFVPVAIALVVLSAVTHLPLWIALFFLGCGLLSRARRASRRTSSRGSAAC
ncbi:DUF1707 SHOCT-like domain-containing protein [Nocardioides rubriscoriae]|uniref:DUF1707 SHOCT-like domain-containing protein n=1 Tax=Nocardioides rubriscoriae TaxID=642762 RepID=UPI0011DF2DEA|nr:DUF1707 domain-containing protein [Nocardioides rubriscoriae]